MSSGKSWRTKVHQHSLRAPRAEWSWSHPCSVSPRLSTTWALPSDWWAYTKAKLLSGLDATIKGRPLARVVNSRSGSRTGPCSWKPPQLYHSSIQKLHLHTQSLTHTSKSIYCHQPTKRYKTTENLLPKVIYLIFAAWTLINWFTFWKTSSNVVFALFDQLYGTFLYLLFVTVQLWTR